MTDEETIIGAGGGDPGFGFDPALVDRGAVRDVVSRAEIDDAIERKLVRRQVHPEDSGLVIYNYTEAAVWEREWSAATRNCRGLILRGDDVMARPWPKFFNVGEHLVDTLDMTARVEVTDKQDGSLGILYEGPFGRLAIATRGSFASEQALHATELFRYRYEHEFMPIPGWTYLFEIVYPGNRIVLDYGDVDDLILLGAVRIEDGMTVGPRDRVCGHWPGPVTKVFEYPTLAEALTVEPRPNAEGLVIRYTESGLMVKLKQADYVALHRIITGMTARKLWERAAVMAVDADSPGLTDKWIGRLLHLSHETVGGIRAAGPDWADTVRKTAPEEFTDWIDQTLDELHAEADALTSDIIATADSVKRLPRKEAAEAIMEHPHRGIVFAQMDGKSISGQVWAQLKPEAERAIWARGEDVA